MVSSLFNTRPVPRKVPCINHPPPTPDPPTEPGTLPKQLSGACQWRDLYAPEFWDRSAFVDLHLNEAGNSYWGVTPVAGGELALRLVKEGDLAFWDVTILTRLTGGEWGWYTWEHVYVDKWHPFDTGLLGHDLPPSPVDLFLLWARVVS